jgi:hypothetical protein
MRQCDSATEAAPRGDARADAAVSALSVGDSETKFRDLICRLFRNGIQFCSGLVDLVVGVRRDGGGGHRLALARK